MLPQPNNEFNDPELKEAVRRCWASECAPEYLRKQIDRICGDHAQEQAADVQIVERKVRDGRSIFRSPWVIWPVSLAACLLISAAFWYGTQSSRPSLPLPLEAALVIRHDECCQKADHQGLPVARDNDHAIEQILSSKLKRAVVVFHPQDPAWVFKGAAVCPVGETPAEHLVFVKTSGALSVFGLPGQLAPSNVEGSEYAGAYDKHSIVAFVKDGALFCLVSSGPEAPSVDDLKQMETRMSPNVVAMSDRRSPVQLTELLQPVR